MPDDARIGLDTSEPPETRPIEPAVRIGLEVHVYLRTRAKLFCACSADALSAQRANLHVCPVCTGQPGSKPMAPNRAAFEAAVDVARALGSDLQPTARFLRKHYFYPDLPSNYQRTSEPIAVGGTLDGVRFREMHVEEDPGAYDPASGLIDYNRSGSPLLEIVTEPDIASPEHARRFLNELRLVLSYVDAWREDAGVKADVNVSVHGGERAEVKNVHSVRDVERAATHEIGRQLATHAKGERQVRETRAFDSATGRTTRSREKESEADYRYVPDPDLLPVDVIGVAAHRASIEPPLARRARIANLVGATEADVSPMMEDRPLLDAFEVAARGDAKVAFTFFVRDVRAELEWRKVRFAASGLDTPTLARLVEALVAAKVTPQVATRILRGQTTLDAELGGGSADLGDAVRAAIAANPKAVADYRAGKPSAVNFLVGQAMKALKGRADANALRAMVEAELSR